MTAIKENLKRISDSLIAKAPEVYALLRPGLKSEEIEKITKDLPFTLPEEILELYQWHNGLSKHIGIYEWLYWESSFYFDSLTEAIECIAQESFCCFLAFLGFIHENGGDYYSISLDKDLFSVIVLDEDTFFNSWNSKQIFACQLNSKPVVKMNKFALDENDCLDCLDCEEEDEDEDDFEKYFPIVEPEPKDFLQKRKIYNNLSQLIAKIADCCDRGLERIEINENS